MNYLAYDRAGNRSYRKTAVAIVLISGIGAVSAFALGWIGGFRVNLTPSEPVGLWRIVPLDRAALVGDVVFICPPGRRQCARRASADICGAVLCPAGYAPLIKAIVGVGGQDVAVGVYIRIAGHPVSRSNIWMVDGEGRPMARLSSGVIPAGQVFVHSAFIGSFDSRYFGPIPASGILGLAREVWTYAP